MSLESPASPFRAALRVRGNGLAGLKTDDRNFRGARYNRSVELSAFSRQTFAMGHAILDEVSTNPAATDLRSVVRSIAGELATCADANEVMARLRQDPAKLRAVAELIKSVSDEDQLEAIERAHRATSAPTPSAVNSFCQYLNELCAGPEPGNSN